MLKIDIITDPQKDKIKLQNAWQNFHKSEIPEAFILEDMLNWWEQYQNINNDRIGHNKTCKILLIYNNEKLKGILPLMTVERFKLKLIKIITLEFMCQTFTASLLDLIHKELTPEEVRQIFSLIKKTIKHDLISLSYLDESSILLKASLGTIFLHAGKVIIPLEKDYGIIKKEVYSKNLRHILNKFNRRIRESGNDIRFDIIEGKENIRAIKDKIVEVSLSKLLNSGKHSLYKNAEFGNTYFEGLLKNQHPFCSVYFDKDELVSYNIGYIKDNVVYAIDAAYKRTYADAQKIGLGILAYDKIVEYYSGKNKFLDMGFGLDDYKFRFSKKTTFTKTLILKGNTFKSAAIYKRVNSKSNINDITLKQVMNKYLLTA